MRLYVFHPTFRRLRAIVDRGTVLRIMQSLPPVVVGVVGALGDVQLVEVTDVLGIMEVVASVVAVVLTKAAGVERDALVSDL